MARTEEQQQQTATMAEHFATLSEIYQAISSSLDLDVVMQAVLDKVIEVVKAQRGFLMLSDAAGEMQVEVARGLNKEDLATPEYQYSTTIVNLVIDTRQPLLTNNAEHDDRFEMGTSIVAMSLRSIMCVPLEVKGRLIGVVYVDNTLRAGVFREADLSLLAAFAAMAAVTLDNARLHQIEVNNARLERELSMAYEIQRSMLPRELPTIPGYELAADWRSAREVAGDFYDVIALGEDRLGVVIADVADKGIAAALFMAVSRSLLRGNAIATLDPEETLQQTNRLLLMDDSESGMFVTVYYSILGLAGQAVGVNAGHNRPLWYHQASQQIEWLPKGGHALGWFANVPLEECPIELEPGDILVYYTDGLTEAENRAGEFFGEERLAQTVDVIASRDGSATNVLDAITSAVDHFVGDAPPFDDLTMIVVKYTGA